MYSFLVFETLVISFLILSPTFLMGTRFSYFLYSFLLFSFNYCFVSPMLVDSVSPMYLFSNDNCMSKKIHSIFFLLKQNIHSIEEGN